MTPDEINAIFNRQIEVQNQPLTRSLSGNPTARGLSLVTVEGIQAEAISEEVGAGPTVQVEAPTLAPITNALKDNDTVASTTEAPVRPAATTTVIATQTPKQPATATQNDPNKPLVYAKLDSEFQINLQIKFGYDSAALDQTQKNKLSTMCTAMQTSSIGQFRIIGHTDTSGSDQYNQRLSVLRAKEVARHLVQDCGIASQRLETVGMGERFPLNNSSPEAEENRRVEFQAMS